MPYAYTAKQIYLHNNCECKSKMEKSREIRWMRMNGQERGERNEGKIEKNLIEKNASMEFAKPEPKEKRKRGKYLKTYWINSIENMYGSEQCAETVTSLIMLSIVWIAI